MIFVQLDPNNIVVAELHSEKPPAASALILDVTTRNDGPWMGKRYDKINDAFVDAKQPDVRPIAVVTLYDPQDQAKAMKTDWMITEPIGIDVSIQDGQGNVVKGFNGIFGIPIMRYDPVAKRFSGTVRRLRFEFISGEATRTFSGFVESGDYGIDDRVSDLAKVATPLIVTVLE